MILGGKIAWKRKKWWYYYCWFLYSY